MATFLHNQIRDKWAILAPKRVNRHADPSTGCPFCPDKDDRIPNNTEIYRENGVYVIANKNPLTGIHEVIIFSKDHDRDLDTLPKEQVFNVFKSLKQRYLTHQDKGKVVIFQNRGAQAGATVNHPHAQLVVVPREIKIQTLELQPIVNIIFETEHLVAFCPDFSQFSFEVWIAEKIAEQAGPVPGFLPPVLAEGSELRSGGIPTTRATRLLEHETQKETAGNTSDVRGAPREDTSEVSRGDIVDSKSRSFSNLSDSLLEELSGIFQKILQELIKQLSGKDDWEEWVIPILWKEGVHYNWYISSGSPWYLRVIPRLNVFAGLEFSTGLTVNMISPSSAAQSLRS